jgi:hypothetical protein
MIVEDFLPVHEVSDAVATVVDADFATTWDALMDADLIEVGRRRPLLECSAQAKSARRCDATEAYRDGRRGSF